MARRNGIHSFVFMLCGFRSALISINPAAAALKRHRRGIRGMATSHGQLWQAACEGKMICARSSDVFFIAPSSLTKYAARIPIHSMRAMVLTRPRESLRETDLPTPKPRVGQVLVRVRACAVCRTDLHIVDGELTQPKLPLVPGHEIVGEVVERGEGAERFEVGTRVGIPWLGWTCGDCRFCRSGRENLCEAARFTGYTLDGRYAEFVRAARRFCFPLPELYSDAGAAPLLCAGLIGYRALVKAGDAKRLGIYGFGAAAHIVAQVAHHQGRQVYAFTRPGDREAQQFAHKLGAAWAGYSNQLPPERLDAAIIFAP